jgi:hypothetical protein
MWVAAPSPPSPPQSTGGRSRCPFSVQPFAGSRLLSSRAQCQPGGTTAEAACSSRPTRARRLSSSRSSICQLAARTSRDALCRKAAVSTSRFGRAFTHRRAGASRRRCGWVRSQPGSPNVEQAEPGEAHSHLRVGFDCNASGTGLAWRHTNGLPGSPKVGTNSPFWTLDPTPHPCRGSCLCAVVQSIPARSPLAV